MRFSTLLIKNLLRRKVRSILTAFGIAIAVGTTVSLLGIAEGFKRITYDSIAERGVDLVAMESDSVDQLSSDIDEDVLELVREIPGVAEVSAILIDLAAFDVKGSAINVLLQGWEPGGFLFNGITVQEGRNLNKGDKGVVVLGYMLAKQIEKSLGDTVEVEGEPFKVVGIYESFVPPENTGLIIPLREMQRVRFNEGRITGFGVVVDKDVSTPEKVVEQVNALKWPNGKDARVFSQTVRDYSEESFHLKAAEATAWLTSAIAIIVGAIGILNTMVMSVAERIREISILRAIGWKKKRIVSMVLGESVLICIAGAFLGVIGALLLNQYLTRLPWTQGLISGSIALHVILFGFAMATGVGLLGGIYPSFKAASLPPSHGLRSE